MTLNLEKNTLQIRNEVGQVKMRNNRYFYNYSNYCRATDLSYRHDEI